MSIAIKVENLSKAYQIGEIGTGTLSRDLERWWAKARGKEDPFLRIGETNDRTSKSNSDVVWSLKNIDFEIHQGDAVGVIGRNGAGKSTLLKILSRVTSPTTGKIVGKGRIASLLEVGTGFHPELTGRENIYLNGAILGMRKKEITRKFDEIVSFAGVERYIDTPVKRYSSGMYVRLAFAVAAHLEAEILIVDEVLAVGDAEFQKKCLGKMGDISKAEGRTVLFVSHNMGSIKSICNNGLLLVNGTNDYFGKISDVIDRYTRIAKTSNATTLKHISGNQSLEITNLTINNKADESLNIYEPFELEIHYKNNSYKHAEAEFFVIIYDNEEQEILSIFQRDANKLHVLNPEARKVVLKLENNLRPGSYKISAGIFDQFGNFVDWVAPVLDFNVNNNFHNAGQYDHRLGKIFTKNVTWI